ncbi:hypothetical protein Tco_0376610, partial [Tanacetum coccineum]
MKYLSVASGSSWTPSTVKRSPLDFDNENPTPAMTEGTAVLGEEMASVEPLVSKRQKQLRYKRGNEEVEVNTPPKVLRRDHTSGPTHSTTRGKSLASMRLEAGILIPTPTP